MAERGVLDVKERNGQVRSVPVFVFETSVTSVRVRVQTALQIAAATNNHLIVRDLLTHGANVNTHDLWGRSLLHVCAQKGHVLSLQVRNH